MKRNMDLLRPCGRAPGSGARTTPNAPRCRSSDAARPAARPVASLRSHRFDLADVLPEQGAGERFDVEQFYRRVAGEEGGECTAQQARQHARAVVTAMRNTLPQGEVEDFTDQLPADYTDLLSTGTVHH